MLKKVINIINNNSRSVTGVIGTRPGYFYKLLSINDYNRELAGYEAVRKKYPVPKLLREYRGRNDGVLIFENEKSIGLNKGLLADAYSNSDTELRRIQNKILDLYKKVFLSTIFKTKGNSSKIFFEDRIESRLKKNYSKTFFISFNKRIVNFNGKLITINLAGIRGRIEKYFSKDNKKWSIVSQCDPGDLNIGIKPIIFDFSGGGYNPLMAEFAVFFWYNMAQNSYFSPKYNKGVFADHKRVFMNKDKVVLNGSKLIHEIDDSRKVFLIKYIDSVILPVLGKIDRYDNWYEDFKNYLAMRILCVFDVAKMEEKDKMLSLVYLDIFYNAKISNLSELKNIIYEIHG